MTSTRTLVAAWTAFALVLVFSPGVAAQYTRDGAANKKIEEAISQHYFGTKFKKAEAVLTGTIKACEDKCKPGTLARAWMYIGIVRGSGMRQMKSAQEAFLNAVAIDPTVKLDEVIANEATKQAWSEIAGVPVTSGPPPDSGVGAGGGVMGGIEAEGDMECTLSATEVQTRRQIEFACTSEEEATKAELAYQSFGSTKWTKKDMKRKGDYFIARIPCSATMDAGNLKLYVRARDAEGVVDKWGSRGSPVVIKIVTKTTQEPPSLPDRDPPERCAEKVVCPPDFPGCGEAAGVLERGDKPWGSTCEEDLECAKGLACKNGSCEDGVTCDVDDDCDDGSCVENTCARAARPEAPSKKGGPKKLFIGIHIAQDLALVGGEEVCSRDSQTNNGFACFFDQNGELVQYGADPQRIDGSNRISSGIVPATTRFLLSGDYALTQKILLGGRLGYAVGGGPAPVDAAGNEVPFLPFHVEARGSFWFKGKPAVGFYPYVHVGGGLAQVDAKVNVKVRDCAFYDNSPQNPDGTIPYDNCANGVDPIPGPPDPDIPPVLELEAYKKLGQGFGTLGGGAVYGISPELGIGINLNLMMMLPTSGIVIQPSIGAVYGLL